MKPTQADVLLRIAENTFADGDEVMAEMSAIRRKLAEHARRVLEDEELLIRAWEINQQDKARVTQYLPVQATAKAEGQGRAAFSGTLSQQRMAIGVIKEANKDNEKARTGS